MAAEVRARTDKHGTIAFTLPISCQICLGKVRKPVLCPNNHVFCSPCIDVWLQRNQQCPACRISINPGNPLKKIIGGLNHIENDKDKMSNPELRKTRFDLLFREYEDEFERITSELTLIKAENDMLRGQLAKDGNKKVLGPRESLKSTDSSTMLTLTKKLQDAQKLYEKVKSDLGKMKEENNSLKDENINLNHENQKLRTEIASRSPHRYGRVTVSTLETKVQTLEKENGRLNKAMEKNDKYIEELQKELESYKGKDRYSSSAQRDYLASYDAKKSEISSEKDNLPKRQLFTDSTTKHLVNGESYRHALDDDYLKSYNKTTKSNLKTRNGNIDENDYLGSYQSKSYANGKSNGKSGKRVTFDLPSNVTTSFDLEMPSPMKQHSTLNVSSPSPVKGVLKNGKKSPNDTLDLSKPSSIDDIKSYKSYSKDDSDLYLQKSKSSSSREFESDMWKKSNKAGQDESFLNDSFSLEHPRKSWRTEREFDDTQQIQRELDDLDISLTPDFTDCMKLLNRAEKKVHNLNDDSLMDLPSTTNYRNNDDFIDDYKSKDIPEYKSNDRLLDDIPSSRPYSSLPDSTYTSKYYSSNIPSTNGDLYAPSSLPPYSTSYKTGSVDKLIDYDRKESNRYSLPADNMYNGSSDIPSYDHRSSLNMLDYKPQVKDDIGTGNSYSSPTNKKYPSSLRFGRSPSLDNLFISKPSQSSGSRYATAEDIPGVRSSLPDYTSTRFDDDRLGKASLPPRPQSARSRSYSDMGSSVASLPRGNTGLPSNIDSHTNLSNGVSDNEIPVSSARYSVDIPVSSSLYNVDSVRSAKPPMYTTNTRPIGNGPIRAQQSFAYTDVDLGVNPRHRAMVDGSRTRSSSLDIPLTEISKYSSTKSSYIPPTNPVYPVSFSGSRPMDDGYSSAEPRYSSSYIPSSLASSSTATSSSYPLKPIQETGYSYVSNNSSLGINGTDSFLPEPKKRLFDSSDDFEMSLSPIKSTRKM